MSLEDQGTIKNLVDEEGVEDMIVVLGAPDAEAAELYAETLSLGDPTYAGVLTGVALGLPVYYITEPGVKGQIPEQVYQDNIGMMEMVLPVEDIAERVQTIRTRAGLEVV